MRELARAVVVYPQNFPGVNESNFYPPFIKVFLMAFGVTGRDSLNLFYVRLLPVEIVSPSLNEFSPPPAN